MENYTVFICDDIDRDRKYLHELLLRYGKTTGCSFTCIEFGTGKEAVSAVEHGQQADIIFLDINMDGMDGIETSRRIRDFLPEVPIVLVTAYINYALEGYKVKASRFLVKDDLEETIGECLDAILAEIGRKSPEMDFSFVEGRIHLKLDDIIYIETDAHVQVFHTIDKNFRVYKKLEDVEKELASYGFIRAHKSFVVNLRYVTRISSYKIYLSTGMELSVPRNRYNEVKTQYAIYKGGNAW